MLPGSIGFRLLGFYIASVWHDQVYMAEGSSGLYTCMETYFSSIYYKHSTKVYSGVLLVLPDTSLPERFIHFSGDGATGY